MLKSFTDEELQAEIERRKEEKALPKPKAVENPDFSMVVDYCKSYIDDLYNKGWVDDDMEYYVFEAAIQAVFGKDIFDWIKKMGA